MKLSLLILGLATASLPVAQSLRSQLPIGSNFPVAGENATYDYVVVGAGTAGLALATRLAQDGRYSVAVLEAGSYYELDNGNRSVIPAYDVYSAGTDGLGGVNPLIDWEFMTTAQAGANNETKHYARGKCLGGCSARNFMVYQRPTVGAMQKWADDVGDQSWVWDKVLPYYKRSTTFTPPDMSIRLANSTPLYDAQVFGDGPVQVSYARYASPLSSHIINAWDEIGDPMRTEGLESGELLGHQYLPSSLEPKTQERSTSKSYLDLALLTTELNVYTHAFVKQVLFDDNKAAVGVKVDTDGMPYTITATKEVILSAGAFQSPQLLMVSGIGPAETLTKYNIPVIHDLPGVGQNMEDNPLFGITFAVDVETSSSYSNNPARFGAAITEYNENRTGFLTSSGADAISFEKLVNMDRLNISAKAKQTLAWVPEDWPDIQFWGFTTWLGDQLGSAAPDTKNYACFLASLTAPLSRGYVTINSSDMADAPIANPN
ncbi:hypothetical protein LTR36_002934 [Oleoguttula mirabilis]|uniref:Glucose-methanol-choline oxidoreductase N-terminal domain-containing protein n=1 Tax=Oleoguttula mirabilis TaxID=1507867 RepID=A0AAV9JJJ8_9PEZI|nr:hypothetical protein LTR36_002934 [Oleoguttula mirabilis]